MEEKDHLILRSQYRGGCSYNEYSVASISRAKGDFVFLACTSKKRSIFLQSGSPKYLSDINALDIIFYFYYSIRCLNILYL